MIDTEKKEERVLLIGVELQGMDNFDLHGRIGQSSQDSWCSRSR